MKKPRNQFIWVDGAFYIPSENREKAGIGVKIISFIWVDALFYLPLSINLSNGLGFLFVYYSFNKYEILRALGKKGGITK